MNHRKAIPEKGRRFKASGLRSRTDVWPKGGLQVLAVITGTTGSAARRIIGVMRALEPFHGHEHVPTTAAFGYGAFFRSSPVQKGQEKVLLDQAGWRRAPIISGRRELPLSNQWRHLLDPARPEDRRDGSAVPARDARHEVHSDAAGNCAAQVSISDPACWFRQGDSEIKSFGRMAMSKTLLILGSVLASAVLIAGDAEARRGGGFGGGCAGAF